MFNFLIKIKQLRYDSVFRTFSSFKTIEDNILIFVLLTLDSSILNGVEFYEIDLLKIETKLEWLILKQVPTNSKLKVSPTDGS